MADKAKLKAAFTESWDANAAMLGGAEKIAVLKTAVKAIAERDFLGATDAEIDEVIAECLKEINAAAADFTHQTWTMPR